MNALLWVLQALLALAFLAHGLLFLFPPADVVAQMNALFPRWFQLFLGVAEVLAAVGLTLPGLTRIQPWLVPSAAGGIVIVMIGATILHILRNEVSSAVITAVLLAMAAFVAYARWRIAPIPSRGAAPQVERPRGYRPPRVSALADRRPVAASVGSRDYPVRPPSTGKERLDQSRIMSRQEPSP